MAASDKRPIVIKRIKKVSAGSHGGAWKIAYADFVTAMMAFFLLLWLLASVGKEELAGISDYFKTPLVVAMTGGTMSSESSSKIKGGGSDLTRDRGEVRKGEIKPEKTINVTQNKEQVLLAEKQKEMEKLKELKKSIEQTIEADPQLKQFKKQILLDITSEGLRIQIVDEKNRPMFQTGSAKLEPYTKDILHEIGKLLNQVPNKVSLSGHTDAQPYSVGGKGYGNWELSADRANASRRELLIGNLAEDKVVRVVGLSSSVLFDKVDPFNPINRRISIIVMNKKTEEAARNDGGTVEVDTGTAEGGAGGDLRPPIVEGGAALPSPVRN